MIPYGYCHCGCGQKTGVWERTQRTLGRVAGEAKLYARGHNGRTLCRPQNGVLSDQLCECGCSQRTKYNCGTPNRFAAPGHGSKTRWTAGSYIPDPETGCWVWQGPIYFGYGFLRVAGEKRAAHRVHYERVKGPIPKDFQVHHKCANKACVNPDHLEALSRVAHARVQAKLSLREAREIRRLAREGMAKAALARRYGVSIRSICGIVADRTWKEPLDSEWICKPFAEALNFAREMEAA